MPRKVNTADMTIREQVAEVREAICDGICKFNDEANEKLKRVQHRDIPNDDRNAEMEIITHELIQRCKECPCNRL